MAKRERRPRARGAAADPTGLSIDLSGWRRVALGALFFAIALLFYAPALGGEFLSDDIGYLTGNPWVVRGGLADVLAVLNPFDAPAEFVANYAPVHLLLHALEWKLFGSDVLGYHVVNVALHALGAWLLVLLLQRHAVPDIAAALAGTFFLLHPANVEAVAWISQLKTLVALDLVLGALLLQFSRPRLAALLFALAFLTKAVAACALPAAAAFAWARVRCGRPAHARWLLAWLGVALAFSLPQAAAFERLGHHEAQLHPDLATHLRSIVAFGARYLAMAATAWGVSAFQAPPRALSWLDPWWLAGLALGVLFAIRIAITLVRASPEAGFWLLAAAAWAPVAQLFPFIFPMADRYLYLILPGLIGGTLLAARELAPRLPLSRQTFARGALVLAALLIVGLALRTPARARLFHAEPLLVQDAAENHPDGIHGRLMLAFHAAQEGDAARAAREVRAMAERGFVQIMPLLSLAGDPGFAAVRHHPDFEAALSEIAGRWLERARQREEPNQAELFSMARAHALRGEVALAREALERALERGGPYDDAIERELARFGGPG